MPMIKCSECGGAVSDRLAKCPHCGAKIMKRSERYSQFYEQPKQYAQYQPEPRYEEVREKRSYRKSSSKSTALSISAIILSLMGLLTSFMAIIIASSKTKEVYVEKEVPVYQEIKDDDIEQFSEEISKQETEDYSKGSMDYSAEEPIFYTFTNSIGDMEYCFIQEIRNTGDCPIYLKGCDLDIEDKNGHLISTESFISNCPDVILPGETGYFYNSLGTTTLNESAQDADALKVVPSLKIVESREDPIEYEISDTSLTKGTFDYPTVTGRVTNNTEEDDSLLYLNVIFYDFDGNVIAITGVNVQDLTSGSTKGFECTSLTSGDISYEDIGDYKVIARKGYYQF